MAAADVGDTGSGLEPGLDAFEGGNPVGCEIRKIAGPEEALAASEQALLVLVPAEAFAGAEYLGELFLVLHARGDHVIEAGQVNRAVVLSQGERLLRGHVVGS